MSEIEFDKYARKGAYHWRDYYGGLLRMNAGTKARYDTVVACLQDFGVGKPAHLVVQRSVAELHVVVCHQIFDPFHLEGHAHGDADGAGGQQFDRALGSEGAAGTKTLQRRQADHLGTIRE